MAEIIFWAIVVLVIVILGVRFVKKDMEGVDSIGSPMKDHPNYPFGGNELQEGITVCNGENSDCSEFVKPNTAVKVKKQKTVTKKVAKKKVK